jgi:hypothetical protein
MARPSQAQIDERTAWENLALEDVFAQGARVAAALDRAGIFTVKDLTGWTAEELRAMPGMDEPYSVEAVQAALAAIGMELSS